MLVWVHFSIWNKAKVLHDSTFKNVITVTQLSSSRRVTRSHSSKCLVHRGVSNVCTCVWKQTKPESSPSPRFCSIPPTVISFCKTYHTCTERCFAGWNGGVVLLEIWNQSKSKCLPSTVLQCPDSACKQDLLAYLQRIALYCHQLNICSKVKAEVQNLGGELIVSGVSSCNISTNTIHKQYRRDWDGGMRSGEKAAAAGFFPNISNWMLFALICKSLPAKLVLHRIGSAIPKMCWEKVKSNPHLNFSFLSFSWTAQHPSFRQPRIWWTPWSWRSRPRTWLPPSTKRFTGQQPSILL